MNERIRKESHSSLLRELPCLSDLPDALPPIELMGRLNGEANFYGAAGEIARQLGLPFTHAHGAHWEHGWKFGDVSTAEQIGGYTKRDKLYLVSIEKHATIMREEGFANTHAVGLPYLYAPKPSVKRIPNSLLVCPGHTSVYSETDWSAAADSYAEKIESLRSDFSEVVVCLTANCIERNQWVHEFEKRGIPWILGASIHDRNALRRMRSLFAHFEFLTTNCIGSHLVYASYEGCKTSIWNWQKLYDKAGFTNEPIYKSRESLLDLSLLWSSFDWVHAHYGELFCSHPKVANARVQWAAGQMGEAYLQPLQVLADRIDWNRAKKQSRLSRFWKQLSGRE